MVSNLKKLVFPHLEQLENKLTNQRETVHLSVLKSNLNEIMSSFSLKMSSDQIGLSNKELQVADYIRNGKTNKEIASQMNLSRRTIESHRENIRKKLGLCNKKVNLQSYLSSSR